MNLIKLILLIFVGLIAIASLSFIAKFNNEIEAKLFNKQIIIKTRA